MITKWMHIIANDLIEIPGFEKIWEHNFNSIAMFKKDIRNSPAGYFSFVEDFVEYFCKEMPYLPHKIFSDAEIPTLSEIRSVGNYILDYMFILTCLDHMVWRYLHSGEKFNGWEFDDYRQNYGGVTNTYFDLVNKEHGGASLTVIITTPYFSKYNYEDFGMSINKFMGSTSCGLSLRNNQTGEIIVATDLPTTLFKDQFAFLDYLKDYLAEYNEKIFEESK